MNKNNEISIAIVEIWLRRVRIELEKVFLQFHKLTDYYKIR